MLAGLVSSAQLLNAASKTSRLETSGVMIVVALKDLSRIKNTP
jgi:hypothetical protein